MTAFFAISYLVGAAAVFDALRRPASAWVAADRNRGAWLMLLIFCSAFALGLIVAPFYLLAVVPRFRADAVPAEFEKR